MKELTPFLLDVPPLPRPAILPPCNGEYVQPGAMAFASLLNIVGSVCAISAGADRVNGNINPFFYLSPVTSLIYFIANVVKLGQIKQQHNKTWAEIELDRRAGADFSIALGR